MGLQITVFGPTRVERDGVGLDLGGRRPAEVLALLAAAEHAAVPAEVLADRLWRGRPPATAATTLQGYVARLRRLLEPGRSARDAAVLVTAGGGYALRLPRPAVDAHRFADLVGAAAAAPDDRERARLLAAALAVPAGRPYGDVADVDAVRPSVARLDELRLGAVEALAELRLAGELIPELTTIALEHPLRERTRVLLARALYRAGRQADALAELRDVRRRLADELGVDPSVELRRLEQAMLRHDPALAAPPADATLPPPPADLLPPAGPPGGVAPPSGPAGPRRAVVPGPAPADEGFVGRTAELAALDAAWAAADAGRGTAVVVTGEPGIGKTRLVEAFARRGAVAARWGRCPQVGGAPPYWPWQQILGGLPDAAPGGEAGARFAVGLDVARRLRALARPAPLLVVLDDLQWADPDSVHVLEILLDQLRDLRLLLALTCRDDAAAEPALARVLARAGRVEGARRISLGGLAPAEVGRLAAAVRGQLPPAEEVAALADRTGGNPFFVAELAALGGGTGIPAGVRDVLRLRLAALTAGAADVVAATAVAGREVAGVIVAAALGRPLAGLDGEVRRAVAAGVLEEPAAGRLRVPHDLVREVVLADLGPGRRAALHRGVADTLESGPAAATSAAAIAVHRCAAAAGAADEAAARACLRAAGDALARAADGEAEDVAARGVRHVPPGADVLLADLELARGAALRRLGRLEESAAAVAAAAAAARRLGDADRLARAALTSAGGGVGGYWATVGAPGAADTALLREAAGAGPALTAARRSAVLAALAVQRASAGHADAVALADAAARSAADAAGGRPGIPPAAEGSAAAAARARAAVARFVARWTPERAAERVGLARAMAAESPADAAYRATGLHLLRCALMETLQPDESAAVSRRYAELAARRGDGDLLLLDTWWHAGLELARGRFAEARRLGDEAVAAAPTASPAAADVTRMSRQTLEGIIAWHERRMPEVVPDVADLAATVDPDWLLVLAQAHAQAGRRAAAYAAIERLREHPGASARAPARTVLLADLYLELGDAGRAATLLPALRAYGDTVIVLWAGTTVLGPAALYRGGVLALLGDPGARAELDRAEEICDLFGFAPFAARAAHLRAAAP